MKRIEMIKSHGEFSKIIKNEKYIRNKNFSLYYRDSLYNYPHFGIAVSKKLGNAVTRNKLKRKMRVILDTYKKQLPFDKDYIIIMKENTKNISFKELEESFNDLLKKEKK